MPLEICDETFTRSTNIYAIHHGGRIEKTFLKRVRSTKKFAKCCPRAYGQQFWYLRFSCAIHFPRYSPVTTVRKASLDVDTSCSDATIALTSDLCPHVDKTS